MNIDIHAHVIIPETMGKAGKWGPEIVRKDNGQATMKVGPYESRVGPEGGMTYEQFERMGDPKIRLADMDALGIDVMGISVSPLFYLYWAEDDIRTSFAKVQNDALAKYCAEDPKRFFWLATLPLPNIEHSLEEVRRVSALGAKGINIGTGDFAGIDLDNEKLWPLYELIESLGMPIFIHPYPLTMADGAEDRYNLSWMAGYNYQETMAFAHLTLGGVFDAFPNLKVCITHGGGFTPYQMGRLEEARRRAPDVRAQKSLVDYGGNVFYDILLHDLAARQYLVDFAGPDQLVVGDNFGGWDAADGFGMLNELALPPSDHEKIASGNAAKLFRLG